MIPAGAHSEVWIRFLSDSIINDEGFAVKVTFGSPFGDYNLCNFVETNLILNRIYLLSSAAMLLYGDILLESLKRPNKFAATCCKAMVFKLWAIVAFCGGPPPSHLEI